MISTHKTSRRMGHQIRVTCFRRVVTAVLFMNRLIKMRPTQIKQELTHDALTISQIMPVQDSSSSKLVQRLRLSYQLQDQVQSLLLEKYQYNGSLLSLLSIGNKVLSQQINKISQQHPIDYTVVQSRSKSRASLEGVLCIFKSKEYLNRHLLNLERTFEV